jgi:hypothetical protein
MEDAAKGADLARGLPRAAMKALRSSSVK